MKLIKYVEERIPFKWQIAIGLFLGLIIGGSIVYLLHFHLWLE